MLLVLVGTLVVGVHLTLEPSQTRPDIIRENYSERLSSGHYRPNYSDLPQYHVSAHQSSEVIGKGSIMAMAIEGRTGGTRKRTAVAPRVNIAPTSSPTLPTSSAPPVSNSGATIPRAPAAIPAPIPRRYMTAANQGIRPAAGPSAGGGGTAARIAPSTGTGYSGGAVTAGSTGVIAEVAPPPPMSLDAYGQGGYAGEDAAYVSETASAEAALRNLVDQLTRQNTEYDNGFKGNLKSLGWKPGDNGDYVGGGQWDTADTLGAYGQSYNNMQNDYSGRGMMDSTFYQTAQTDLTDRFNRQRSDLLGQRDQHLGNSAAARTAAEEDHKNARQRALVEAYTRYTSGLGV